MKKSKFTLDPLSSVSLTKQLTDLLRKAIVDGAYRPGETLPGVRELAAASGTSLFVSRAAIAALTKEGLVNPRPRIGSVVTGSNQRLWRGNVLVVLRGYGENYTLNTAYDVLRCRLLEAGYFPIAVSAMDPKYGTGGFLQLDRALRDRYDLAIVLSGERETLRRIRENGLSVLATTSEDPPLRFAGAEVFGYDFAPAMSAFADHCVGTGVKTVVEVECGFAVADRWLAERGIRVRRLTVDPHDERRGSIASVMAGTCALFERLFADPSFELPEMFYFADDFIATAALASLARHGISVPGDVRVVCWENVGLGPVASRPLTCLSFDAVKAGETLAKCALDRLAGKTQTQPCSFGPVFRVGETA